MFTDPTDNHRWLHRFVGDWTFQSACDAGSDAEPPKHTGRETVTAYSDLWIVADGEGDIPDDGGTMRMRTTLGFDPNSGRYTGTWIGSPMAFMFVYNGSREGDALTLDTTGPGMADHTVLADYRDIYELHGDDKRSLRSHMKDDDGNWVEFMRTDYTRVK